MQGPKIPGGYILLSRKIIESEIWDKPPLYLKVWVYILSKVQHTEYKKLERGQTHISIPELMEACSWYVGYRKEKPTKDQIYNVIRWLRSGDEAVHEDETSPTMITTTKATHGMLVEVCNYSFYQDSKNYENNSETTDEKDAGTTRQQRQPNNINKNGKNVNNVKEYIPYAEIIEHLNKKADKRFRSSAKKTKEVIHARWTEGHRLEDFKRVIDICCEKWKGQTFSNGADGDDYLQPSTLFNGKFDERLNWTTKKQKESKPRGKTPEQIEHERMLKEMGGA